MKKALTVILSLLLASSFVLASCDGDAKENESTKDVAASKEQSSIQSTETSEETSEETTEDSREDVSEEDEIKAKYVRYIPEEHMREYPYAFPQTKFVIHSTEELRAYLGDRDELYDYGYDVFAPEPTVPFYAYEVYNDEYFEDNILVLVLVEEGSGSIRRRVADVTKQNGSLEIDVDVLTTGWGTCDMAYWTLFIELDKGYDVTYDKVTVNDKLVHIEYEIGA